MNSSLVKYFSEIKNPKMVNKCDHKLIDILIIVVSSRFQKECVNIGGKIICTGFLMLLLMKTAQHEERVHACMDLNYIEEVVFG